VKDFRSRLTRLASNFWWSWSIAPTLLFRSIDQQLWRDVNHNPIAFLEEIDSARLEELSKDAQILAHTTHAERCLQEYLENPNHWSSWNAPGMRAKPAAYFSLEFCIHESLRTYSGGLGVLAGDHLKSCSDLGVPIYAVGLLYRQGYFRQEIDEAGLQHEVYHDLDTDRVALELVCNGEGAPLHVTVPVGEDLIELRVWKAQVGRCPLFLLDLLGAALEKFPRTLRLYGGDKRTRIVQELVLGIGGYRTLRELGVRPGVLHLNEGHSAFATLEAIAERMEERGLEFQQAAVEIAESVVFTTHTPVAAGHDRFDPALVLKYLRPLRERLGLSEEEFLALGRVSRNDASEEFCMTVLALTLSRRSNAVSSLHGGVSRNMWRGLWPEWRAVDIPIGHVTNGVHVDTWLAPELEALYAGCLGRDWERSMCRAERWRGIDQLDALNLWSVKVALKGKMFNFIKRREERRRERLGKVELSPLPNFRLGALTIGFARRFASYKRALLLFDDYERAKRIITNPDCPVQLIFAGKAHPADEPGKALLQRLVEISNDPDLKGHVFVLENHDMNVSRHLLQGCDLWLNAPRRPLEACGTSGMKAVFNATLNCSILDGWWDEGYDTQNGFAFGDGLVHIDSEEQDRRDLLKLYEVLENEVVPLFYLRDEQGVPTEWLARVKNALKTLAWRYNSDRMVMEYVQHSYLDAAKIRTAESLS